ncbi:MAG TPA: hypothetical protein VGE22_12405 [Solimonas sp.]
MPLQRKLFLEAVTVMENAFGRLQEQVPPPQRVPFRDGFVFRFREQTIHQALILKLARVITGLRAVDVLLQAGLLQEQGAICRMLDEIDEDIMFLVAAVTNDRVTELHQRYLAGFWAELFADPAHHAGQVKKPDAPRRKKIHAYVSRVLNEGAPPAQALEDLSRTYSGYVHAASACVMDMYGGDPPHFHLRGMGDTPLMEDHVYDVWNYVYRGLESFIAASKAFGDEPLVNVLYEYLDRFIEASGDRAHPELKVPRPPIRKRPVPP